MRNPKPRILWIYGYSDAFGGSWNSLRDSVRHFDPQAFDVRALLPCRGSTSRDLEVLGLPVFCRAAVPAGRNLRYLRAVWSICRLLARETIDLVYFADYAAWKPAALVAARLAGVPVVAHLHAVFNEDFVADRYLRTVEAIIGNSRATLNPLRRHVAAERLHVVYNGLDFEVFGPGSDRRGQFFPRTSPLVGFVGIFRPEKGIEYFLEMVRILRPAHPQVRYLLVGGDSPVSSRGWLEKMMRRADDLGICDVVRFTGSRTDIPEMMRSLDVLVVPSLTEGFGRVIVEANAVGTPVVGSDVEGIPEVIEPGLTGLLVPPRDPQALATAVERILADPVWRARVAAVAPKRVRERFDPAKQARAIEAVWRLALAG